MKAYVINLDNRPDRLDYIAKLMDERGIDFERIPAVNGRDPEFIKNTPLRPRGPLRKSVITHVEIATTNSHIKAWQRIVESGAPYGAVFEDDIYMSDDIAGFLSPEWIPEGTDIIRLETLLVPALYGRRPCGDHKNRHLYRPHSDHFGMGAYIVSAKACAWLIDALAETRDAVDVAILNPKSPIFKKLDILQLDPAPAVQALAYQSQGNTKTPEWAESSIAEDRGSLSQTSMSVGAARRVYRKIKGYVRKRKNQPWRRIYATWRVISYK